MGQNAAYNDCNANKTAMKHTILPPQEIRDLSSKISTPYYVYDATKIRQRCEALNNAFQKLPNFCNYYAVKALPNPNILCLLKNEGFGADCSSMAELNLAEAAGFIGEKIMFTSNNTPLSEYKKAKELGAIINIDDASHVSFLHETIGLPSMLCCRYNPGKTDCYNDIIGNPESAKFGMTKEQLIASFKEAARHGVKRFGLHTMIISNCLDMNGLLSIASMMFSLAVEIEKKLKIQIDFVNLGGGIGIPYKEDETEVNLEILGEKISSLYQEIIGYDKKRIVKVFYECGRFITGPCGSLVTRIIHQKDTYKKYLGVDACINSLMRPALYGAYHHITVVEDKFISPELPSRRNIFDWSDAESTSCKFDIVGSLCENNDKLAIDRVLPIATSIGDLLVFHDTGAHGHCMGFNYNGKLRVAEYLKIDEKFVKKDSVPDKNVVTLTSGSAFLKIRRAETLADLFGTIEWCF